MNERPDNVLSEEDIEDTVRREEEPILHRGMALTPWATWGPGVMGATILFYRTLLIEALEELKDIVNCAGNGQPISPDELVNGATMGILNRAHTLGIRLAGEED